MARNTRLSSRQSPTSARHIRQRAVHGRRMQLEPLEQRLMLATVSWNTDGDGFWDVATNWQDDMGVQRVPGSDDDVVIDRGAANPVITLRSGAQSVKGLQAHEGLSITGGSLTIAVDSEISAAFTLSTGTLTANGQLTLAGASTWTTGTVNGNVRNEGTLTINSSFTVNFNNGTLTNADTIIHTSTVLQLNGGVIENLPGALIDVRHAGSAWSGQSPGFGTINNSGTVQKSVNAGVATASATAFNNLPGGIVSVLTGEFDLSGGGNLSGGSFNAAAGAFLDFQSGTFTLSGKITGTGPGKVRLVGTTLDGAGGSAELAFAADVFEWVSGTIKGTLANMGELTINNTFQVFLDDGALNNSGVITSVAGQLTFTGGTLNNLASGLIDIQRAANATIWAQSGVDPSAVSNSGTVQRSGGAGVATLAQIPFNNLPGGIVSAVVGELRFNSNTNWQGAEFQTAAGASVVFNAGTHTFAGMFTGSGAGKVKLTGTTFQIAAAGAQLDFDPGVLEWAGGFLTGGTLTNTGALTIDPPAQHFLNNGTIANAGVVTHTSGQLNLNGGTIKNLPGGVWEVQHATAVLSGFGPGFGVFDNRGTFLKTTNAGTASTPAVSFDNRAEGSIVVNAGTLSLSGGGRNEGGALHAEPGTILNFVAGGTHVLTGNYTGTGGGKIRMTAGRALIGSAGATFDFDPGVFEWTGGVLTGFAPLVNKGSMLVNGVVTVDDGALTNAGIITQIGTPTTSNIQMTRGGITGGIPTGINVAFTNLAGALYDMQMAPGTFGITGFAQGQVEVNNFGTIRKSSAGFAGFSSVRLNNVGVIEVLDGDFELADAAHFGTASILQFQGGQPLTATPAPLTGGTWRAVGAGRILFPANITANAGTIILEGNGDIPRLSALASNSGTFSLLSRRDFTRAGDFTNTGELVLGPDSTLTVNSALTLGATSEIEFQIGGTPASGLFGNIMVLGAAMLDGAAELALVNGFDPEDGQSFQLMAFASKTGDFASFDDGAAGRTVVFSSATTALNFTVNVLADGADLDVTGITIPANGLAGQNVTIDYTVNNDSAFATPAGPWTDSLYLSLDDRYESSDVLLGRVTHNGQVGGNATYNGQLVAPLPGVLPGNYRVLVIADSRGLVPDTDRANNTLAGAGVIAADIPALMPGVAFSGTVAAGQDLFFRVDLSGGGTPSFTLVTAAAGGSELYLRQLDVPDRANFDESAFDPASTTQRILDTGAAATTHFILIHGRENAGLGTSFTLTAEALGFGPVSTDHNTGAPLGRVTTTIHGSLFSPATTYSLVTPGTGALVPAVQTIFQDPNTVFATFDLTGLPLGNYGVRATDGAAQSTFNAGFTVVNGTPGALDLHISAPRFIRPPFRGTVATVEFSNIGDTDIPAPILLLSAPGVNLRLPEQSEFVEDRLEFLGINPTGPAGILPPGFRASVELPFQPRPGQPRLSDLSLQVEHADTTIAWDELKDALRPATTPADAWDAIFANFTDRVGTTQGQLQSVVDEHATYLSQFGIYTRDVSELVRFELILADNFGELTRRFALGPFGRGVPSTINTIAVTDADGSVTIRADVGFRTFTPLPDGSLRGSERETGVLTRELDSSLRLRERTGLVTAFLPNGRIDFVEDANGNRVTHVYTGGRVTSLMNSDGETIQFAYDGNGRIIQVTDSVGRATTFTYDASGEHLTSVTDPSGTIRLTYSPGIGTATEHAIASIEFPDSTHVFFAYDANGRLVRRSLDGGASAVSLSYGPSGRTTITDASGAITTFDRDHQEQLARVTNPLGQVTGFEHDAFGNLLGQVQPDGTAFEFGYDARHNRTRSVDPLGHVVETSFEPTFSQLTNLTDARGNATDYSYDGRGNLVAITYADGQSESFTYDALGNTTRVVNRRGQSISFTYDADRQLTEKTFADGSSVDFTYDGHRNLISHTDSTGTTTFEYDAADRLAKVTYPGGRFLEYTYDAAGRRAQTRDQDGFRVNYAYDSLGRLLSLRDTLGSLIASFTYDAVGRVQQKTLGNGTFATYGYDLAGRLASVVNHAPGGSVQSQFEYTYDQLGRRTSMTTVEGTTTFGYDATGQLTMVTLPNGRVITYEYDPAGNRIAVTDSGATTNITVNELNQYETFGTATFTYDPDGNLISKTDATGVTAYSFDDDGRLTAITGPTGVHTYQYDALGNLVSKTSNGVRTDFLVDPSGIGNVVAEYTADGALISHYTHGAGLTARVDAAGQASFYGFDGAGNVSQLTAPDGTVANRYSYLPFGELLASDEQTPNPFRFVGQFGVFDDGNGLYYMRHRWYRPELGRFVSPDPINLLGGDANLYRYVRNAPTTFVDPSGLQVNDPAKDPRINLNPFGQPLFDEPQNEKDAAARAESENAARAQAERDRLNITFTGTESEQEFQDKVKRQQNTLDPGSPFDLPSEDAQKGFKDNRNIFETRYDLTNLTQDQKQVISCMAGFFEIIRRATITEEMPNGRPPTGAEIRQAEEKCFEAVTGTTSTTVTSTDPNNIIGPAGFNADVVVDAPAPGQMRFDGFVGTDAPFNYTIQFENKPTASAPAQVVKVTHTLDGDLDFSTFRFQNVGWGDFKVDAPAGGIGSSFHTVVDATPTLGVLVQVDADLNLATGLLEVTFTSLDPTTGDLPLDPFAGFLPPNTAAPIGDGFINFNVRSKPGLADGTRIDALATVVFDTEPPLDTPAVHNTIDASAPTSTVNPLPATTFSTSRSFIVSWSGSDDAVGPTGSGVAFFDVFVSDNGGPFTPIQLNTPATSATFTGEFGHTYSFFAIATDNVGNSESTGSAAAEATTTLLELPQPAGGPRVTDLRLPSRGRKVTALVVSFDRDMNPTEAQRLANYELLSAGKDNRFATRDDRTLVLRSALYNPADRTVTLTPVKKLKINQAFQLTIHDTVTDLAGNRLDGDADGTGGVDHVARGGAWTRIAYIDDDGDRVTLRLDLPGNLPSAVDQLLDGPFAGLMEVVWGPTVTGRSLHLVGTTAGASVLTGHVSRGSGSDGQTILESITGLAAVRNRLPSSFIVGTVAAAVDEVLERGP